LYEQNCQGTACKEAGNTIARGELRFVSHRWRQFDQFEQSYNDVWRHWRCVTPAQIETMREAAEGDATKVTGYEILSAESRKQIRLAFKEGKVTNTAFKDIRDDLVPKHNDPRTELTGAEGYRVSVAKRVGLLSIHLIFTSIRSNNTGSNVS
jgi:hypothetical protein